MLSPTPLNVATKTFDAFVHKRGSDVSKNRSTSTFKSRPAQNNVLKKFNNYARLSKQKIKPVLAAAKRAIVTKNPTSNFSIGSVKSEVFPLKQ